MALIEREKSGAGQYLDMALYDCAVSLMHPHIANFNFSGEIPGLPVMLIPTFLRMTLSVLRRSISLLVPAITGPGKVGKEIGEEDLINDPRFVNNIDRATNRDE